MKKKDIIALHLKKFEERLEDVEEYISHHEFKPVSLLGKIEEIGINEESRADTLERLTNVINKRNKKIKQLEEQLEVRDGIVQQGDILSKYILNNFNEYIRNGGVGDVAIDIINDLNNKLKESRNEVGYMKETLTDKDNRLSTAKELLFIQGEDGNWNSNVYMTGMYNGMELIVATLEDREPAYKTLKQKEKAVGILEGVYNDLHSKQLEVLKPRFIPIRDLIAERTFNLKE